MDPEQAKDLLKAVKKTQEQDSVLSKIFGDPTDPNNPRMKTPLQRAEEGMSFEDQFKNMILDLEMFSISMAGLVRQNEQLSAELHRLQNWASEKMAEDFLEEIKKDPEKAANRFSKMLEVDEQSAQQLRDLSNKLKDAGKGSYGPLDNSPDAGIKYAGSTQGTQPDAMIETPNGWIQAKDIPGYRNDPTWHPSPDWVDANCMCDVHKAKRAGNDGHRPGDDLPGLYL